MANLDPRLGKRTVGGEKHGEKEYNPSVTISGAPLIDTAGTIGLSNGYFAILDFSLSDVRRDELVAELETLIKGSGKAKAE